MATRFSHMSQIWETHENRAFVAADITSCVFCKHLETTAVKA
jgi:hypothetical protein